MVSIIDTASRWLAKLSVAVSVAMFAAMLAALTFQVVARYAFNAPPTWTEEFSLAMFTWIVLLMGSVGVREGFHVLLDLWPDDIPRWMQTGLIRFSQIVTLLVGIVLLHTGWAYMTDTAGQVSAAIAYPIEALHAAAPACGLMIVIHTVAALLKPPAQDSAP